MSDTLVIVQRVLTHYRVPLFEALRERLRGEGFELRLIVGDAAAHERSRELQARLPWAQHAPCHYALGARLCWQALAPGLRGAHYVVVAQENRLLNNLPLLLAPQPFRVALWGHGAHLQARGGAAAAWLKRGLARQADWCFAYTELSAALMRRDAPAERVTVLDNAVDTTALRLAVAGAAQQSREALRRELGVGRGPLGLFIGSWYADKRLDLLLDAAERVHAARGDFELAIAGAGPLAAWLRQRCAALPWVHVLAPVHGADKARWLAAADVMLNPGLVGLGILDAFAAALPMLTTDCGLHSPEIAYLEHGRNGWMVEPRIEAYAQAVQGLLADAGLRRRLGEAAAADAQRYTLEAMVTHFVQGFVHWRASPRRR